MSLDSATSNFRLAPATGVESAPAKRMEATSARLLSPAVWVALFALSLWAAIGGVSGTPVHNDFTQNVWLPARLIMSGANPYYPTDVQTYGALGEYSGAFMNSQSDIHFNSGAHYYYIYPMWVALILSPFGLFPLVLATAIWRALSIVLLVWSVVTTLKSVNRSFASPGWASLMALALVSGLGLVFRGTILNLYVGQFAIIELGVLTAIWAWLVRSSGYAARARIGGDLAAGVGLAVLSTKPQATILAILLLIAWSITRKRFAIPAAACLSLVVLTLAPLIFYPSSLGNWLETLFGPRGQAASQAKVSSSVWGLSYHLIGSSAWVWIASAASAVVLAIMIPRWVADLRDVTSPIPWSLPLTLCANSLISPYMLGYEHVVLILPALVFLAANSRPGTAEGDTRQRRWSRLIIYNWMTILPLVVAAVQGYYSREFPGILQSLPLFALLFLSRVQFAEKRDDTIRGQFLPALRRRLAVGARGLGTGR